MAATLLQKVWDAHTVRILPTGQTQLFMGLHLIHEVTSPQAFDVLRERGSKVLFPERTFATVDHIIPTDIAAPFQDDIAEEMMSALERNCRDFGIPLLRPVARRPGDRARHRPRARPDAAGHDHRLRRLAHLDARRVRRHRLRHRHHAGARRAGHAVPGDGAAEGAAHRRDRPARARRLRQGRDPRHHPPARREGRRRLRLRVRRRGRRSDVDGRAHDHLQHVHRRRGARRVRQPRRDDRGLPRGPAVRAARRGVRPRPGLVEEHGLRRRRAATTIASPSTAASSSRPSRGASTRDSPSASAAGCRRRPTSRPASGRPWSRRSTSWASRPGRRSKGRRSTSPSSAPAPTRGCRTCARRRRSSRATRCRSGVRALVVPGSQGVAKAAIAEGLDQIFREAGFEWRGAGCSMCLAMNPDKLQGAEICASSSNRNFKGRQGSPTGRTLLMSPAMVAAAALAGEVVDVRKVLAPALTAR